MFYVRKKQAFLYFKKIPWKLLEVSLYESEDTAHVYFFYIFLHPSTLNFVKINLVFIIRSKWKVQQNFNSFQIKG